MPAPEIPGDETLEFFDHLVERQVSMDELLVSAAAFVESTVGVVFSDGTRIARRRGGEKTESPPPVHAARIQTAQGQIVWIDRPEHQHTDSRFFLRRLAVAAQTISHVANPSNHSKVPPLAILLRSGTSEPLLLESLRRLRLRPDEPVRVGVAECGVKGWSSFIAGQKHIRFIAQTEVEKLHIALWHADTNKTLTVSAPSGEIVVAESETFRARDISKALDSARSAMRFAPIASLTVDQEHTLIRYEDLGPFAALASLSRETIEMIPDIQGLDELAQKHGPDILTVLEAYSAAESQRKAAARLHRHHNSISYWVKRAERSLRIDLSAPAQRSRLFLALILYRLRNTATSSQSGYSGTDIRL